MRKLLLIWVAALALGTTPAHADLPVIDATQIAKIAEQLGISQQQLQEMITTYNEIVEVYNVSSKIWAMLRNSSAPINGLRA